jgi:hypothetical protein
MTIGDIRPQDPSDQPLGQTPSDTTPPTQGLDQDEHEGEDEHHDQVQERAMIKGEMRIIGIRKKATQEQNHHIQGCATTFKEITP